MEYPKDYINKIICGDCLETLKTMPNDFVDCVVTSPPYWGLRDYGCKGQLGLEGTFDEYVQKLCAIFDEVKRVLKPEGTCWVNLGDSYGTGSGSGISKGKQATVRGIKNFKGGQDNGKDGVPGLEKSLCDIPFRFSIEMLNRGWIKRNTIIWHKPNCMPSSADDRYTVDFEYLFFFVKEKKYYFKQQLEKSLWAETDKRSLVVGGVKSAGKTATNLYATNKVAYTAGGMRNMRTVWNICTQPNSAAHFATFPPEIPTNCMLAGCPEKGLILDPFMGSGTTAWVAKEHSRNYLGIELNPEYIKLIEDRLRQEVLF